MPDKTLQSAAGKSISVEDIRLPEEIGDIPDGNNDADSNIIWQDVEDRKADRSMRVQFAKKAYRLATISLIGWAVLLIAYALINFSFRFQIFSDTVLIAITSAVTLNVFAAFLGVIRGLFRSVQRNKD